MIEIIIQTNDGPPDGFELFRAPIWPIPELGLSVEQFGFQSFMVIPLFVPETKSWSATASNFSVFDYDACLRIQRLQPKDGFDLNVKMKWLVHAGTFIGPMWTKDSGLEWNQAIQYYSGTMLWGNQIFAASRETYAFYTKAFGLTDYRRVYRFRKSDWLRDKNIEWLYPRATISRKAAPGYSDDFGRGEIRSPLMAVSNDYPFAGGKQPEAFYIPAKLCKPI